MAVSFHINVCLIILRLCSFLPFVIYSRRVALFSSLLYPFNSSIANITPLLPPLILLCLPSLFFLSVLSSPLFLSLRSFLLARYVPFSFSRDTCCSFSFPIPFFFNVASLLFSVTFYFSLSLQVLFIAASQRLSTTGKHAHSPPTPSTRTQTHSRTDTRSRGSKSLPFKATVLGRCVDLSANFLVDLSRGRRRGWQRREREREEERKSTAMGKRLKERKLDEEERVLK